MILQKGGTETWYKTSNGPFPSYLVFQNESWCKTIRITMCYSKGSLSQALGREGRAKKKRATETFLALGPVHTYPDIFESAILSFRIRLPSTRIWRIRQRIRIFWDPLSTEGKNKSATNPIMCGGVNPDIFESNDVANSWPVSYRAINQYGDTTATTGQLPPL